MTDTDRAEFEAWRHWNGVERDGDGEYINRATHESWQAWQHQQRQIDAMQDSFEASQSRAADTIDTLQAQLDEARERINELEHVLAEQKASIKGIHAIGSRAVNCIDKALSSTDNV